MAAHNVHNLARAALLILCFAGTALSYCSSFHTRSTYPTFRAREGGPARVLRMRGGESGKNIKIGFLGMGIMGAPMAINLLKAGYDVTVWNRAGDKCAPAVEAGAKQSTSAAEVFDPKPRVPGIPSSPECMNRSCNPLEYGLGVICSSDVRLWLRRLLVRPLSGCEAVRHHVRHALGSRGS